MWKSSRIVKIKACIQQKGKEGFWVKKCIFLNQTIENLKINIKKRGRDYESTISADYLKKINQSYSEFFKSRPDLNVKFIDVSEMDFVKNRLDYLSIINGVK